MDNIVLKKTEDIKVHKKLEELICCVLKILNLKNLFQENNLSPLCIDSKVTLQN